MPTLSPVRRPHLRVHAGSSRLCLARGRVAWSCPTRPAISETTDRQGTRVVYEDPASIVPVPSTAAPVVHEELKSVAEGLSGKLEALVQAITSPNPVAYAILEATRVHIFNLSFGHVRIGVPVQSTLNEDELRKERDQLTHSAATVCALH